MSADSILLVNTRSALCHCPDQNQNQARTLTWAFWKSLTKESFHWSEISPEEIDTCLEDTQAQTLDLKRAYTILKW